MAPLNAGFLERSSLNIAFLALGFPWCSCLDLASLDVVAMDLASLDVVVMDPASLDVVTIDPASLDVVAIDLAAIGTEFCGWEVTLSYFYHKPPFSSIYITDQG